MRDRGVLAATGIAVCVLEGKRPIQGRRRACRRRRVGRDQLKNFGVRRRGMKGRRERVERVRVQSVQCLWALAYMSSVRVSHALKCKHACNQLTPPMPFRAASILAIFAARASFLRVLLLPRLDSSKIHSWPPDLHRCGGSVCHQGTPPPFGALRTLHGPLGPLDSSGMHRILILRHLHTVSTHARSHPSCHISMDVRCGM